MLAPVLVRLALVPLVDDFDADGYSRALIAEDLAAAVRAGHAAWHSLYVAVWPPAWHVVCALADLAGADPYYAPKVLSAVFGGLTATVGFALARRLGADRRTAWTAWALLCLSPFHVLYSTSAMTEAFYGFWFLLAAWCYVRAEVGNRWLAAAALALAPAALTRFDVWILLPALPVLAVAQRRATLASAALTLPLFALAPLAWLALNLAARGDALAFLPVHGAYIANFFRFRPLYADRGPVGLAIHLGAIVTAAGVVATVLGTWALWRRRRERGARALAALLAVAFAYLFVLWIVRRQIGWRRHYLAIGSALTVMAAFGLAEVRRRRLAWTLLAVDFALLAAGDAWMARWPVRLRQAADFVAARPGAVYCDEPGVRVLSGLPRARFVDYTALPAGRDAAVADLRRRGVRWVVFADVDYSPLPALFPEMRRGEDAPPLTLAHAAVHVRPLPRILVYELPPG